MTQSATPALSTAQPEDFFQLLKPRVMSLVIFTAATGLVVAGADINPLVAAIAILCIAVGAGAAGALNMALEGETDALMRRTRGRPVAAGRLTRRSRGSADTAGLTTISPGPQGPPAKVWWSGALWRSKASRTLTRGPASCAGQAGGLGGVQLWPTGQPA